jgi:transcriptional repressor NrdR
VQCPFCTHDSAVTETRVSADGVRRRRVCGTCKRRFTTYEKVGSPGLKVEKRDGRLEPFDSDKLHRALERIARHRGEAIASDDLRRIVRDVEAALVDRNAKTVRWHDVVRLVLARLRASAPIVSRPATRATTDGSTSTTILTPPRPGPSSACSPATHETVGRQYVRSSSRTIESTASGCW